ncbi:response regulator [Planctomycetales bacterium ZRK34]|nr:response regulator [Planctomycetales bacterium ZRK34]
MANDSNTQSLHRRILIVEDEPNMREMLSRATREMDFTPQAVSTAEAALTAMANEAVDLILLDMNLPGLSGIEFFEQVNARWPQVPVIILTGYGDLDTAKRAIRLNVVDFLTKPCSLADLEAALDRALRRRLDTHRATLSNCPVPFESEADDEPDAQTPHTLQDHERELILQTLARHDGNREATAAELGISLRKLYYRIAEYEKQGYLSR